MTTADALINVMRRRLPALVQAVKYGRDTRGVLGACSAGCEFQMCIGLRDDGNSLRKKRIGPCGTAEVPRRKARDQFAWIFAR